MLIRLHIICGYFNAAMLKLSMTRAQNTNRLALYRKSCQTLLHSIQGLILFFFFNYVVLPSNLACPLWKGES